MPDEGQLNHRFDWRQAFPFTHLFRTFRIAIHPSKLLLGLALLVTVYVGGCVLDSAWPEKHKAVIDEVTLYKEANNPSDFDAARELAAPLGRFGLFHTFFGYQANQFNGVVDGFESNQWLKTDSDPGVLGHIYNFLAVGPLWLARTHTIFAIVFAAVFLSAWSLFGGAIARLAAVHVARDEKLAIRASLNFSVGKFLSFLSAPVIPLLIVLVVGFLLAVASLIGNIPILGPVAVGVMFFLALIAGFVQTLVILGAVGGFNLMYPTVAVEGSDSFDAISRSFSYVYARPWRMVFYTFVAVAYGAATYLFVRGFILVMLVLAHHFVQMGVITHDAKGGPLIPSMWPSPSVTGRLTYHPDFSQLTWPQSVGAGVLSFWIYLVVGILGSFAVSFYFTANTIIYFLMRRELDATEMDDVYLDPNDEDLTSASGTVETVEPETAASPVPPPPPATAMPVMAPETQSPPATS